MCKFYLEVKIEELLDLRAYKCFWNGTHVIAWVEKRAC